MKVLVTGANGFVGKNLCRHLIEHGYEVIRLVRGQNTDEVFSANDDIGFIFHCAGVNRPEVEQSFSENSAFTQRLLMGLEKYGIQAPILFTSSIQAEKDNEYGRSKKLAEDELISYSESSGNEVAICRLPNVFGKWCKPNYNSFVATFCSNIANGKSLDIHDPAAPVELTYIDDVCADFIGLLEADKMPELYFEITVTYKNTVGEVAEALYRFKESRENLTTERVGAGFSRALYSTYLSYLRPEQFAYSIPSYKDERGIFAEMLKTKDSGQFSFFTAHPGVTRGGHYHHSKNEKFLVIKGKARFCFKHVETGELFELETSSDKYEVVETVPGWSHDITNIGEEEMLVILWANEVFDRETPDTFQMETK